MSKRDIGQEILDGIQEIKAHKAGKNKLKTHTLSEPSPPQVIREKLKLSQSAFASLMGVSTRTIQDWEQGRRGKGSGRELRCYLVCYLLVFTAYHGDTCRLSIVSIGRSATGSKHPTDDEKGETGDTRTQCRKGTDQ